MSFVLLVILKHSASIMLQCQKYIITILVLFPSSNAVGIRRKFVSGDSDDVYHTTKHGCQELGIIFNATPSQCKWRKEIGTVGRCNLSPLLLIRITIPGLQEFWGYKISTSVRCRKASILTGSAFWNYIGHSFHSSSGFCALVTNPEHIYYTNHPSLHTITFGKNNR